MKKPIDPVTKATWTRLKSAGRAPIAGKPFGAERMDRNPLYVKSPVPQELVPMKLASSVPVASTVNESTVEGISITFHIALDLAAVVGDPERVGKLLGEAVRLASKAGAVTGLAIDLTGLHVEIEPGLFTMADLTIKRRALQARLEGLLINKEAGNRLQAWEPAR